MSSHEFYMKLALNNAQAMKGQTDPNPLVGSVIVNHNEIVGVGTHLKAGEPHAEIHALRMAGEKAKGGTIYVTLEPCSHHGRTGPCAEAVVEAGINKVVIAALDPNPLVSGRGVQILKDAGIEVETGVLQEESEKMNEVFNKFIVKKIPFVTLKSGITLDGKIASHTNNSKWITSPEARLDVHRLRNENQAILVGVNTVIHDDPELTTRIPNGRNPIRVIMDSTLKIPLDSKVVTDRQAETWVFTSENYNEQKKLQLEAYGVKVFVSGEDRVSPVQVLKILGDNLISSLLIEGGGTINAAFLEDKLVDKAVFYIAPKLIGGQSSPSFFGGTGIEKMADAIQLQNMTVTQIGPDFKFTSYPKYE
ncbi:bifunctional diaminohydroxyphosphoribosylaminopyrimidine deaminase/5-amino-6-(5-phosphoribosylamino)uracil reductase RibD [Fictibacillus sp. UD]|uniref:bifunctional diaminohydroxyphosphoribosylaminopyrimidine deaminase/5-amino-6-(5-phosphoribosylamino)uracil reductase RibD n=1 Tax=Fictibacillus sp. UD TaxID=3038777 RepID=UPI003745995F